MDGERAWPLTQRRRYLNPRNGSVLRESQRCGSTEGKEHPLRGTKNVLFFSPMINIDGTLRGLLCRADHPANPLDNGVRMGTPIKKYLIVVTLIAFAFICLSVFSPETSADPAKGSIHWNGGYIQGIGAGTAEPGGNKVKDRLLAVRAAEVMAQRALAETIHGVRVDGVTAIRDAMKDSVVSSRVEGIIRGAQKVREEVTWEGDIPMATVILRICLVADSPECRSGNSLINVLMQEERQEPSYIPAVYFKDIPETMEPAGKPKGSQMTETVSYDSSRPVTGLILRVERLRYEKELFPVVVTRGDEGKLLTVFSAKSVRPDVIRTHGVARYADTVDLALKDTRLGDNPLMVAVSEVTKENMLVVRVEGARAIRETTRFGNDYLKEAKVLITGNGRSLAPLAPKKGL